MRAWTQDYTPLNPAVRCVEVCRFEPFHGLATSVLRVSDTWTGSPKGNVTFAFVQDLEDPSAYVLRQTYRLLPSDRGLLLWDMRFVYSVLSATEAGRARWWFDRVGAVLDPVEFADFDDKRAVDQLLAAVPIPGRSVVPDEDQAIFDLLGELSPPLWPIERLFGWATDRTETVLFDLGVTLR